MTALTGAALVVAACAAMGVSAALELRRRVRTLTDALRMTERMRSEVCAWCVPLPQVLQDLAEAFPQLFPAPPGARALTERPFSDIWREQAAGMGLSPEDAAPLAALGEAVSRGEPPERAFDLCRLRLDEARDAARLREKERGRLYAALGAAAGCLLALALV